MKKMYVLLMGLLCCASCDKEASKTQPKDAQQQREGCRTACQDHHAQHEEILGKCCDGGHLQKPTKNSSDFEEEKDYKDAQQAIIKKLRWSYVTIQYVDGKVEEEYTQGWMFKPETSGRWDYKKFGWDKRAQGEDPIGHVSNGKPGVQPYAIKGLLENAQGPDIVVIVSTGMDDALGVNQKTKEYLKQLKNEGKIGAYHILNSRLVPATHNKCVGEGKRVYTLLHSTC